MVEPKKRRHSSSLGTNSVTNSSSQAGDLAVFSRKSARDDAVDPRWPVQTKKERFRSLAKVFATMAFGSCFPRLKDQQSQNQEPTSKGFSVSSVSTDRSLLHSFGLSSDSSPYQLGPGKAIIFTMDELSKATAKFSPFNVIGEGGFGTVYRGRLTDGTMVAVKRAKSGLYEQKLSAEFMNELAALSNVEHLNLVKFIGYSAERDERILVVEYVSNGNLREHLDVQYGVPLDIAKRLNIAIDVAHALAYLHSYADRSIIHRDVKSSNILLTKNYRAKVADFGFSRVGPLELDATHVSTQVKGTAGYLDPEYLRTYQLTQKSDVYSFGVLLIEMVTGRRPIELKRVSEEKITPKWAFQMFLEGKAEETLDPNLEKNPAAILLIERLLELAFRCAAPSKHDRPVMRQITDILRSIRTEYYSSYQTSREESI